MAAVLKTLIDYVTFSAALPEELRIETDHPDDMVTVTVYVDRVNLFSTQLYAYEGVARFYDIRSVIEGILLQNNKACADFELAIGSDSGESIHSFCVIMSNFIIPNTTYYVMRHFLTTRKSIMVSREGMVSLTWFNLNDCEERVVITGTMLYDDGSIELCEDDRGTEKRMEETTEFLDLDIAEYCEYFSENWTGPTAKLIALTVSYGERSLNIYITDEVPDMRLQFLNNFNVKEYAELYGVTVNKQSVERSEAHCNYDSIFYDQRTEQTFEVETAALTYEEAIWLNQMLASRETKIQLSDGSFRDILITDSSPEISDSDKEQNRLKFTYKFKNSAPVLKYEDNAQKFTEEFTRVFN